MTGPLLGLFIGASALLSVAQRYRAELRRSPRDGAHECAISKWRMPNDNRILAEEGRMAEIEVPL
ncbi:hypothetical protein KCP76_12240 [Salmonella enterica subsp. enterica serovar Weltevreden]|nr:hypothetical protein KCP76_12240 [Salmonella enterica subsp. enterica serovar Weltevreden]